MWKLPASLNGEFSLERSEAAGARTARSEVNIELKLYHLKLFTFQLYEEEEEEEDLLSSIYFLFRKSSFYLKAKWCAFVFISNI